MTAFEQLQGLIEGEIYSLCSIIEYHKDKRNINGGHEQDLNKILAIRDAINACLKERDKDGFEAGKNSWSVDGYEFDVEIEQTFEEWSKSKQYLK